MIKKVIQSRTSKTLFSLVFFGGNFLVIGFLLFYIAVDYFYPPVLQGGLIFPSNYPNIVEELRWAGVIFLSEFTALILIINLFFVGLFIFNGKVYKNRWSNIIAIALSVIVIIFCFAHYFTETF